MGKAGEGAIHILHRNRNPRREEQDRANKQHPEDRNPVDVAPPTSQRKRALYEADLVLVDLVRKDNGDVGEVECWSGDGEDCCCGLRGSDCNAV